VINVTSSYIKWLQWSTRCDRAYVSLCVHVGTSAWHNSTVTPFWGLYYSS
jgi:hypothetical protein